MKKEIKFIEEFKAFVLRGNVLDMAVGVIIATAFGKITTSLVNDIFMPIFSLLFGGLDFSQWNIVLKQAVLNGDEVVSAAIVVGFGDLISAIINFLLIAAVIFTLLKVITSLKKKEEAPAEEAVVEAKPTSEELLAEILAELKKSK